MLLHVNTLAGEKVAINIDHIILVKAGEKGRAVIYTTPHPTLGAVYAQESFVQVLAYLPAEDVFDTYPDEVPL